MDKNLKEILSLAIVEFWCSGDFKNMYEDVEGWDEETIICLTVVTGIENPEFALEKFLEKWHKFCEYASSFFYEIISGETNLEAVYIDYLIYTKEVKPIL